MNLNANQIEIRSDDVEPFDIRDGRAMISLGPVSDSKYCSYNCPFCYVHSAFPSYQSKSDNEIITWLEDNRRRYNIIYISGDTDSFAGPERQDRMIGLIEMMVELEVEIMITTRAVIEKKNLNRIKIVVEKLKQKRLNFYGCVSIAQFSVPQLEPGVPSVLKRISQVENFKNMGMISILAMRPFLPIVPNNDYLELLKLVKNTADIVLGKTWYSDGKGLMKAGICGAISSNEKVKYISSKMDFDINNADWDVYEAKETERFVRDACEKLDIDFFMTSRPAVDWVRAGWKKIPKVIGIGALNMNFLVKKNTNETVWDEIKEAEQEAKDKVQQEAKDEVLWAEIKTRIGDNFSENFEAVFLGGGAYHVIECLRQLHIDEHLSLDYVGVAGKWIESVRIVEGGMVPFDMTKEFKDNDISSIYVKNSDMFPGVTINRWNGVKTRPKQAKRDNWTNQGANIELVDFLENEDQDLLVKYLASADWIHLSNLFDFNAMRKIAKLLTSAKRENPKMSVSWDIGSLHNEIVDRKPIIRELLRSSDFVVLSCSELKGFAGIPRNKNISKFKLAEKIYNDFRQESGFSLIVQDDGYDRVDIFWKYRDTVVSHSVCKPHLVIQNGSIDVTAASAYLSAAIIDAKLRPDMAFEMRKAVEYGIELVWTKLTTSPEFRGNAFKKVHDKFIKKIDRKRRGGLVELRDNFALYLRYVLSPFLEFFSERSFWKNVIASLVAAGIVGAIALCKYFPVIIKNFSR